MPSTATPFGLRPIYHPSGRIPQEVNTITTGYSTNIFQYAPVKIAIDGSLQAAAAGERAVGVLLGVEYTDATSVRRVSNYWPASTSATNIVAYFTRDPSIRYEIQGDGSVTQLMMGSQFDWTTVTVGSTTSGLSQVALGVSTETDDANAGLAVLDVGHEVDNAWGDTYTNVIVRISEHQDVADRAAYGSTT